MPSLTALSSACFAILLVGACQELPHQPRGHDVQVLSAQQLEQANPSDVAIGPVRLADPGLRVPERELRIAFQRALLQRRYTPLALEAVDQRTIDASYRAGELREDALLEITVERWDMSLWNVSEQIESALLVRMIDARDPDQVLWEGRLTRVLHGYEVNGSQSGEAVVLQGLCDLLAGDLLAALPARKVAAE